MPKTYKYELIPENKYYPILTGTHKGSEKIDLAKVYHDRYQLKVTSDWYEDVTQNVAISGVRTLNIPLKTREQKFAVYVQFIGDPTPPEGESLQLIANMTQAIMTVNGVRKMTDRFETYPYSEVPYIFHVEGKFHKPATFEMEFPYSGNIKAVILERKMGEWLHSGRDEEVNFKRIVENNNAILPADSYIKRAGAYGKKRVSWYSEYIDGVYTNMSTEPKETILKDPIDEIYVQGTLTIEWKKEVYRTATLSYSRQTTTDRNLLPEDSYTKQWGKNGVRTYYREYEYRNGTKTGEWRNETNAITTQPINEIYVEGTMVLEWRKMSRAETIPMTTYTYDDPTMFEGDFRTVEGWTGIRTYTWEEEFKNGISTGRKRNETDTLTKAMQARRIYRGTKPRQVEINITGATVIVSSGARNPLIDIRSNELEQIMSKVNDNKIIEVAIRGVATPYTWKFIRDIDISLNYYVSLQTDAQGSFSEISNFYSKYRINSGQNSNVDITIIYEPNTDGTQTPSTGGGVVGDAGDTTSIEALTTNSIPYMTRTSIDGVSMDVFQFTEDNEPELKELINTPISYVEMNNYSYTSSKWKLTTNGYYMWLSTPDLKSYPTAWSQNNRTKVTIRF